MYAQTTHMEKKSEIVNFRTTPRFKRLLKAAASADGRSMANFLEHLVSSHCKSNGIEPKTPAKRNNKKETE